MNIELFIARRLFFDKGNKNILSRQIIRIALTGIAVSLAAMIISVAVVTGFKNEIRDKVIGFGSHIRIVNYDSNNSYETQPISADQLFLETIKGMNEVLDIYSYATKPGMIKTDEYIQGVVFKGVNSGYNWDFFLNNIIEGRLPHINDTLRSGDILISEQVSDLLEINVGERIVLYFINEGENSPRMLQLQVCGLYRTSLEEFDNLFVIGDLQQVQRINSWRNNQISGFEITISDFKKIERIEQDIRDLVINYDSDNPEILRTTNIVREYPQIFDWLSVLDMNVWAILFLMTLVAGFNMISGILVLILERSKMIGLLKAIGTTNWSVRKLFLWLSAFLTVRGLFWGNVIGVSIALVQHIFKVVGLNPATYYVEYVPINFSLSHIILLNFGALIAITLMLVIPTYFISRISPEKTIRFD